MGGISHLTGYADGPPLFTNTTGGDPLAGLMGSVALFAALHHRRLTGEGQFIDLSQLEASTWFTGDALVEAAITGKDQARRGNWSAHMCPHNTYPCQGGRWVAIACRDDADWSRLASLIGRAEWSDQGHPFRRLDGRLDRLQEIDRAIRDWVASRTAREVERSCQALGIPAGAVLNGQELAEDPHLQARDFFLALDRAHVGQKRYPRQPFRLSGADPVEHRPAPTLGQHTEEVLRSLLGVNDAELGTLESADVTGSVPLAAR
jgi:benzylsuccinate CoA-transferase BbsF subunit